MGIFKLWHFTPWQMCVLACGIVLLVGCELQRILHVHFIGLTCKVRPVFFAKDLVHFDRSSPRYFFFTKHFGIQVVFVFL